MGFVEKMAAGKDRELRELEIIFKSLAKRINRFRPILRDQDFSYSWPILIHSLWNVLSKSFETILDVPIKVQQYGSVVEDFNCRQDFEDSADFDYMIFPTSENIMIHDEMIEYSPENPMHVRIRGADHPVLQSCLVEGTEYVATSALKSFHPAIYGSLGEVIPCIDTWIAQDRMFSLPSIPFISVHLVKNSVTSPAITFAVAVSTAKASTFFEAGVKDSTEYEGYVFEGYVEGQPVIDVWKHLFNASNEIDANIPEEGRNKQFFERCGVGQIKRMLRTLNADELVYKIDVVPALKSTGWPKVAEEWIERNRKWPSSSMVNKVIQEGFHLVVKPPKNRGYPDCDFRLSFSHAEFLLSQEMSDIQRECYLCLKQYHRHYLCVLSDGLTTFHLKNIYLQTIEETGAEMWREGNRAECMMKLLGNLLEALRKKHLPNFFVRSYNLFSIDYIEDPGILESLAETVKEIMENPIKFSNNMLHSQEFEDPWPWQAETKESVPSRNLTPFGKLGTEHQEHVEIDKTLEPQREHNMMFSTVLTSAANQPVNNLLAGQSFDDLKELFVATMRELTDMASNDDDDTLEALDPLERSLVEGFRDIGRKWPLDRFSECVYQNLSHFYLLFITMAFRPEPNAPHPEPNLRRRVLAVIQSVVEITKYTMRQVDSGAPGGAAGAIFRAIDPTAEDTFNWSQVMPPGLEQAPHYFFKLGFEFVENWLPKPAQLQEFDVEDIALD